MNDFKKQLEIIKQGIDEIIGEDNLIENSYELGSYFKSKLKSIDNKIIKEDMYKLQSSWLFC